MPTATWPMPVQESSQVRNAHREQSYEGLGSAAKPSAALRSWPRWSTTLLLRKSRPPRSCGGFKCHAVAVALEQLDRATRDALAVLPIAVIGTKLAIDRVIREDMVRRA